jgi:hypothetical protein
MSTTLVPGNRPASAAFTTLWTGQQCQRLVKSGLVGQRVALTFGGPHQSAPRFSRARVKPGDSVFPVRVANGQLHVLARLLVRAIHSAEVFVALFADRFESIDPAASAGVRLSGGSRPIRQSRPCALARPMRWSSPTTACRSRSMRWCQPIGMPACVGNRNGGLNGRSSTQMRTVGSPARSACRASTALPRRARRS